MGLLGSGRVGHALNAIPLLAALLYVILVRAQAVGFVPPADRSWEWSVRLAAARSSTAWFTA